MKKTLNFSVVLAMIVLLIPLASSASYFSFTQAELLSMVESFDNPSGIATLNTITAMGTDGAEFVGQVEDGTPQWRSIGIGFPWGDPNLPGDLSAFSGYAMYFYNNNNQNWWLNLYMNTGWTDPPWSETDNFYQNGWTELAPGFGAVVVLDFATAGVSYLNHVTNIGFQVAFNESATTAAGLYQGDDYHLQVKAVSEPATLMLLGLALLGVVGIRRYK